MCYGNHHGMRGDHGHAGKGWGGHGRWGHGFGGPQSGSPRGGWFQPPVNVQELEDRYELHLAAPGRTKADFQLSVQGDLLTISAQKREESDLSKSANWTRLEFKTVPFERQFQLNEKIDAEGIGASYTDGVLVVTLPKVPGKRVPAKDILVA